MQSSRRFWRQQNAECGRFPTQDWCILILDGAYGFVMASNYNSRPRPPEVMVDGDTYHVVRARETLESLWAGEALLPEGAR